MARDSLTGHGLEGVIQRTADAFRAEERRRAEHESGGELKVPGLAAEAWRLEEAARLTAEVNAIWERCAQDVRWADARRKCGDLHRYRTGLQGAWLRVERAFAQLGEPANGNRHRPELKLVAGEHPAFVDPETEVA